MMGRNSGGLFVALFAYLLMIVSDGAAAERERLAVLNLEAQHGVEQSLAEALSSIIRDEIYLLGEYVVMSQEDLRQVASREALIQAMGCDDGGACLVDFGRSIGTRFMVVGAISRLGKTYTINLRMLDTKGADAGLVNRVSEQCKCSEEDLIPAVQRVAARLTGKTAPLQTKVGHVISETAESKAMQDDRGDQRQETFVDPILGMEFVFVEGGCFTMGDVFGDGHSDEKPEHEVCVGDFFMSRYEVTQALYQQMMGTNPAHFNISGDHPVEQVSWYDTQTFIRKISERGGGHYRLPSEAEWEYAARSGGRPEKYAGGDSPDHVAWYDENSGGTTHPVGRKRPNDLGLYDMLGNVWEWCSDWYDPRYYSVSPRNNPPGSSTGKNRAARGGGWGYKADRWIRTTSRGWSRPDGPYNYLGFRLVRDAVSPGK